MRYDHLIEADIGAFSPDPLGRMTLHSLGGGGSSSPPPQQTTTQTSIQEPPAYVKGPASRMLGQAESLSKSYNPIYGGQTLYGMMPDHYTALSRIRSTAKNGNAAMNDAQNRVRATMNPAYTNQALTIGGAGNKYAGNNPYLSSMIDQASDDVTRHYSNVINPNLDAMDRASGAFGNTGLAEARSDAQRNLAEQLGDISSGMRFQNYQQSADLEQQRLNNRLGAWADARNNQLAATQIAPQFAAEDWRRHQNLLGAGDIMRNYGQQVLDDRKAKFMAKANLPLQRLDILQNAVRTGFGGGGSTTATVNSPNPNAPNKTANMIGTGLTGLGLLSEFGAFG